MAFTKYSAVIRHLSCMLNKTPVKTFLKFIPLITVVSVLFNINPGKVTQSLKIKNKLYLPLA